MLLKVETQLRPF